MEIGRKEYQKIDLKGAMCIFCQHELVCMNECPLQSFTQEVAKGRSCHFHANF